MVTTSVTATTLNGPQDLDTATIDRIVKSISPGVYVLSKYGNYAHYVGRSDEDLRARLKQHVGTGYNKFWYAYCTSPRDAFQQECIRFHQHGGTAKLDNKVHPARPAHATWHCPRCTIFG